MPEKKTQNSRLSEWISAAVLLIAYFIYWLLQIRPELCFQAQQPLFLTGTAFLRQFFSRPGGLLEYASHFLSQSFLAPFLGAACMTLIAGLIIYFTWRFCGKSYLLLHFILLPPLVSLYSRQGFPLNPALGMLLTLAILNVYQIIRPRNPGLRIAVLLVFAAAAHLLAGGWLLFFSAVAAVYEWTETGSPQGRIAPVPLLAAAALLLSFLSSSRLFTTSLSEAYFSNLPFFHEQAIPPAAWALLVIPPALLALRGLWEKDSFFGRRNLLTAGISFVVLAGLGVAASTVSFDKKASDSLKVDLMARQGKWKEILDFVRMNPARDHSTVVYTNLALCRTGRLSESMFSFNQELGATGLLPPGGVGSSPPLQRSDIFLAIGLVNESKHWAYESLTSHDESPYTLIRLAQVHALKDDAVMASRYVKILGRSPAFRSYPLGFEIKGGRIEVMDADLRAMQDRMPLRDFVINAYDPPDYLKKLLEQAPGNREAFEYLAAFYLLNGDLESFADEMRHAGRFGYRELPRHFQEALILYLNQNPSRVGDFKDMTVNRNILDGFREFQKTLSNYKNNRAAARPVLRKNLGGTYWYFALYILPTARQAA